jgi:hypothetical protein
VIHYVAPDFWACYRALPAEIKDLADRAFAQLIADPHHPSIHFKKVGPFWSARVGLHYRTLATEVPDGMLWFWIGTHAQYDRMIG